MSTEADLNVYLCCTPLHVLLAGLESSRYHDSDSVFVIINDAPDLHCLARALLGTNRARFLMLPGAAHLSSSKSQVAMRRANTRQIRAQMSNLAPKRLFIFYDQSPEAQAILNFRFKLRPRVTWLEDGITTYSISAPFPNPIRNLVKNKLRYDLRWRGSKWLGQHPSIDEIGCFYPNLLRTNSNIQKARPIPRTINRRLALSFSSLYGGPRYMDPVGIILIPHSRSGPSVTNIFEFIDLSLGLCSQSGVRPLFKFHPRDTDYISTIAHRYPHLDIAEQKYPLELISLAESNISIVTGYRTSALHILAALRPQLNLRYYEWSVDPRSAKWVAFYQQLGIPSL